MRNRKITMGIILGAVILGMAMPASASAREPETEFELSEQKLIRDKDGRVVGIDITEELPEVEFTSYTLEQLLQVEQFKEYEALGLTYDADSYKLFFAGMEVVDLQDKYKEGAALHYDGWGYGGDEPQISVTAVRDEEYHLLYFEFIKQGDDSFPENGLLDTWGSDEIMDDSYEMEEMPENSAIIGGADEPTDIFLADMMENDMERDNRDEQIQNLYEMKKSDTEDADGISSILYELFTMGYMPDIHKSYDIENENGKNYLHIEFEKPFTESEIKEQKLVNCADILLVLLPGISEVQFEPVEDGELSYMKSWDRQDAKEFLDGRDIEEYGKSLEEFKKLFQNP